jgi:Mg2+ and Co2+ transporter CorA
MNAHVQRRKFLFDDTLKICFSKASQSCEVPKEETEPIVVIFQIETATHPFRQLIDEAKLTVVIARVNPIKHSTVNRHTEWLTWQTIYDDVERLTAPRDL